MNDHIKKYLLDYIDYAGSPGFAVLLNGKWGAGKTHFIKQFVVSNSSCTFYYISLYGLNKTTAIDLEFYRQLHPFLSSGGMKITGKLLKGLLRTTIKVDLNEDGKSDGSISPQIPDFNIESIKEFSADSIIIFDDLERCSMPTNEVMGYINSLVEHEDIKVIICANEEQIVNDKNEQNSDYLRVKEKLVGKTLAITPSTTEAINYFLSELPKTSRLKNSLLGNIDIITDIFNASELLNLRLLKTAFYDLEHLSDKCDDKVFSNPALISGLIASYLCLHLEIASGNLKVEELFKHNYNYDLDEETLTAYTEAVRKYKHIQLSQGYKELPYFDVIDEVNWKIIFSDQTTLSDYDFADHVHSSHYFKDPRTVDWINLWHYHRLDPEEFDSSYESVSDYFWNEKYECIGETLQVAGLLLQLVKDQVIDKPLDEVTQHAKKSIRSLYLSGMGIQS